jgi:hypothetical protein
MKNLPKTNTPAYFVSAMKEKKSFITLAPGFLRHSASEEERWKKMVSFTAPLNVTMPNDIRPIVEGLTDGAWSTPRHIV